MKPEKAKEIAQEFVNAHDQKLVRANLVGSYVRNHADLGDVDLLLITKKGKIPHQRPLNLFYTDEDSWEAAVLHWSVGKAIIHLKSAAGRRGYKLNRDGLWSGNKLITSKANEICERIGVKIPEPVKGVLSGVGRLK